MRARRFAIVGGVAAAISIVVFLVLIEAGVAPALATVLRLAVALPLLYAGYSRWMLADTLAAERATFGPARAEARMLARIAGAVGASALAKLIIEPVLTAWLMARMGPAAARWSPLVGELGYGPLANWLVLTTTARRA